MNLKLLLNVLLNNKTNVNQEFFFGQYNDNGILSGKQKLNWQSDPLNGFRVIKQCNNMQRR